VIQRVDTNLLNGGIILSSEWFTRYRGKPIRRLADKGQYGLDAFHRLYRVDNGWVYVIARTPEARQNLCQAIDGADFLQRYANRSDEGHAADTPLAQALAQRFAVLSLQSALARLQAVGIACAPAVPGDSEIFLNDPHAAANDMIATYQHPVLGREQIARHYVRFGHTKVLQGRPTALLGEHTPEVLQEVGFSEAAIAGLYAQEIVKTQTPNSHIA